MGHRRFAKKTVDEEKKEHPYERTPNPLARNYYDEMAPVNGIIEYSQETLEAASKEREELRDAVSKRMGELLLRGVTMLDAYCQTCNGILMQDRNGQKTCVQCEICAERVREGSKKIAEIELDSSPHPAAIRHSAEPTTTAAQRPVTVVDVDRSWASEPVVREYAAPKAVPKKTQAAPKVSRNAAPPPPLRSSSSSSSLPGYNAAIAAVDEKMAWAAEQLSASTDVQEIRGLLALIGEGMNLLRHS